MGIHHFTTIREQYIKATPLKELAKIAPNVPVNLYFDGTFYMFRGCINKALQADGSYNSRLVAQFSCDKILHLIRQVERAPTKINKIYIYFDGYRPGIKLFTSEKRQTLNFTKHQVKLNKTEVQNMLASFLNAYKHIEIKNLIIGEGEHEIFKNRDRSRPALLFTDDSDLFHIAYGYEEGSCDDLALMCTTRLDVFNLSLLKTNFNMPRYAFVLLMMLRGSDFTNSLYTTSMTAALIKAFNSTTDKDVLRFVKKIRTIGEKVKASESLVTQFNRKNKLITENNVICENLRLPEIKAIYSKEDIYTTIRYFLMITLTQEIYTGAQWPIQHRNREYNTTIFNTHNEIESLWWSTNYSTIGSSFPEYNDTAYNYTQNLSKFSFFTLVLSYSYDEFMAMHAKHKTRKYSLLYNVNYSDFSKLKTHYATTFNSI